MLIYQCIEDENLVTAVENMIRIARSSGQTIRADFDAIYVTISGNDEFEEVMERFFRYLPDHDHAKSLALSKGYHTTFKLMRRMQARYDELVMRLAVLDFQDSEAIFDWLARFQRVSEHWVTKELVPKQTDQILDAFAFYGFKTSVEPLHENFTSAGRKKSFLWLVGRALAYIEYEEGNLPRSFHTYIKIWKGRYKPYTPKH